MKWNETCCVTLGQAQMGRSQMEGDTVLDLRGVIPAILTPFTEEGQIDEGSLRREIRYLLDEAGVDGITVAGTTGEGYTLDAGEVRRVSQIAIDEVKGDVPVVAGIIVNATSTAISYVELLRGLPLAALQVTPVHYLFNPGDDGHVAYFRAIGDTARLPLIIYNVIPWSNLSVALLARIVREVKWVRGIKQSDRDLHKVADLVQEVAPAARIYTAVDDLLYPSFVLGVDGTISAIPTIVPKLCVELWRAVQAGDQAAALDFHRRLLPIWRSVEAPDMPARIKVAVNLQGRSGGYVRSPFQAPPAEVVAAIRAALEQGQVI